jgi:hypothetical protein
MTDNHGRKFWTTQHGFLVPSRSFPLPGILVPSYAVSQPRPPVETEYTLLTMGLESLTGQRRSIEEVATTLSWCSLRRVLGFSSSLDAILEYDGVTNLEAQQGLAYGLLPDPLADRAIARLGGEPFTVIFSHQ